MRVLDVSNPTNLLEVGFYELYGYSLGVDVVGDYAYVVHSSPGWRGLQVFDVTDPTNPTGTSYHTTVGQTTHLYVVGRYAYLATAWTGLEAVLIEDPANPTLLDDFDVGGATDVYATGENEYIYIADRVNGLIVLRLVVEH